MGFSLLCFVLSRHHHRLSLASTIAMVSEGWLIDIVGASFLESNLSILKHLVEDPSEHYSSIEACPFLVVWIVVRIFLVSLGRNLSYE